MKIAYIGTRGIPPSYGGSETYVEQMALNLAAKGDEIWVYGSRLPADPSLREHAMAYPENIRRIELPTFKTKHLDNFVRTLLATMHVCLNAKIEVVEYVNLGPSLFAFIPRLFGKRVVGAIRAMDSRREKWGLFARLYLRVCERLIFLFPHATTTNSEAIVDYYLQRYGVHIHFTPNGVIFPESGAPRCEMLELGLEGKDYVLFAARLVPEKQCHVLIRAFQSLEWPGMKLVIAGGDGFAPAYVRELKQTAGDRVLFVGHVGGQLLEDLFRNAYAFVLPSSVEGMSNSLLSAMASGIPVIISDIAENLSVVKDASSLPELGQSPALVFRLGDANDLGEKLAQLRDDPRGAKLRGDALQVYSRTKFCWKTSAERVRRIYEDIMIREG